jgi:hypothetical protein
MKDANDTLSRLVSEIARLNEQAAFHYWEISAMGAPSECCHLVAEADLKDKKAVLARYGYTEQSYYEELDRRTSPRWVFFNSGEVGI